jgi:class 3 adenylate cyclase
MVFGIVAIGGFFASALVRESFMRILRLQFGIDYDLRRRLLPTAFVQKTVDVDRKNLVSSVKMTSSGILCVACDWKGFHQTLKSHAVPDVIAVLSAYYDECVELMHQHFPAGDCAIDWMADEFVVYVPYDTQDPKNISSIATSAMAFSKELIRVRKRCFETSGYPVGIDIGIALGRASYGLSGTNNAQRMLAFGYPVSLARALQHHVKQATLSRFSEDHIAVSYDFMKALPPDGAFEPIATDRFLRNMGVETIYVACE